MIFALSLQVVNFFDLLLALLTASTRLFKANTGQVTSIRRVSSNDAQPYSPPSSFPPLAPPSPSFLSSTTVITGDLFNCFPPSYFLFHLMQWFLRLINSGNWTSLSSLLIISPFSPCYSSFSVNLFSAILFSEHRIEIWLYGKRYVLLLYSITSLN